MRTERLAVTTIRLITTPVTAMLLTTTLVSAWAAPAWAGRSCEQKQLAAEAIQAGFEAGVNLFQHLQSLRDDHGQVPEVVLLARVGSDLSQHGLRFSHMGFAVRDHPKGPFTVVHMLNHCGEADSDLYIEGLANFFLDDPFAYDARVVVPSVQVQRALAARLLGDTSRRLHDPRYNMVARPRSNTSQNSNQWVLELLVSALEDADLKSTRAAIHALPSMGSFRGDMIRISRWKRLGGIFQANVNFFDQPLGNRLRSKYEIVTVRSVVRWLETTGHLAFQELVYPPDLRVPVGRSSHPTQQCCP